MYNIRVETVICISMSDYERTKECRIEITVLVFKLKTQDNITNQRVLLIIIIK